MSRNPIHDNFIILCNQLNLEKILPYLKHERMVTTDEYQILTNATFTARQKREKLLIWLPRKGRNYFTNFGKCLVWSGQVQLARHIGVDVASVPEAPFKLEVGMYTYKGEGNKYRRYGFLSACAYCKISKKLCA